MRECLHVRDALEKLLESGFDALSPDRIAALEAHLNSCPACAQRAGLSRSGGRGDPLQALAQNAPMPTRAEWSRVWSNIEAAAAGPSSIWSAGGPALLRRMLTPLAAAAACIMMTLAWRAVAPQPPRPDRWSFAAAGDVSVLELEVGADVTAVVSNGPAVIWVIESDTGDSS